MKSDVPRPEPVDMRGVREIVADAHRRRANGESLTDEAILAAHPESGTELAEQLRSLCRVEQAKALSDSSQGVEKKVTDSAVDLPKDSIPGYRLENLISRGGQGSVYRAVQTSTGRVVAIKTMFVNPLVTSNQRARFEQEVRFLAHVEHPHIVKVHHAGSGQGFLYLVMDLVDGVTLDEYASGKSMTVREVVEFVLPICNAVHAAHMAGIIHRDLKPGNIVVDSNGKPHVIDFGLAKLHAETWDGVSQRPATITGQLVGSLPWLSPEQADGESHLVDVRTDVYALGLILYRMSTGRHAYALVGSIREMLGEIATTEPRRPSRDRPEIGIDLDAIVMTCLSKAPADRYQSVHELEADLRRFLAGDAVTATTDTILRAIRRKLKRHRRAVIAVVVPVVVALATIWNEARTTELRRKEQLASTFIEIRRLVDDNHLLRETNKELEKELRGFLRQRTAQYFSPEKDRRMHAREDEVRRIEQQREANFYRAMEQLGRAERLGAKEDDVKALRGALLMEEYLDEINQNASPRAAELQRQIAENDPKGVFKAQMTPGRVEGITTIPPGAKAYLFRLEMQSDIFKDGEHRKVPVPTGDAALSILPGTWALRVHKGAGGLKAGDLILSIGGHPIRGSMLVSKGKGNVHRLDRLIRVNGESIRDEYELTSKTQKSSKSSAGIMSEFKFERDGRVFSVSAPSLDDVGVGVESPKTLAEVGDVAAEVFQNGAMRSILLPTGLVVRVTSQPLFVTPDAMIGVTPVTMTDLAKGDYLLLLRADGYEDFLLPMAIGRNIAYRHAPFPMNPLGTTPAGFRYVSVSQYGPSYYDSFWIKEHEVTAAEYLEFLNAPETLARIDASASPTSYPRSQKNAGTGGYWDRSEDGRFMIPSSWGVHQPVFGVSWSDANAYAHWLTAKSRKSGLQQSFSLPTLDQWTSACLCVGSERRFVWGNRFRAKWASSCYARPTPGVEPVMSFPIDESHYGVYDTAGSVSEWLDEWWLEDRGLRWHVGGSWADGGPEGMFGINGGNGGFANETSSQVGFRVVLNMR